MGSWLDYLAIFSRGAKLLFDLFRNSWFGAN